MSLDAWKIDPSASNSRRRSAALVMLPLWATAISPLLQATLKGCAFSIFESPVVEYRVWPIAMWPGRAANRSGVKMSATWPIALWQMSWRPSLEAMPADSWPRCCRAYKPK